MLLHYLVKIDIPLLLLLFSIRIVVAIVVFSFVGFSVCTFCMDGDNFWSGLSVYRSDGYILSTAAAKSPCCLSD